MRDGDLEQVAELADEVHPSLPEDISVFQNRMRLYPRGCHVLAAHDGGGREEVCGYAVGHPWRGDRPPKLDTVYDRLPDGPDRFYIHDVAIAAPVRGRGHSDAIVATLLALGSDYPQIFLVSVYGTGPFWSRFGFCDATGDLPASALAPYGPDARYMVRRHFK